eukprot:672840-Amphidinium_carterae.1
MLNEVFCSCTRMVSNHVCTFSYIAAEGSGATGHKKWASAPCSFVILWAAWCFGWSFLCVAFFSDSPQCSIHQDPMIVQSHAAMEEILGLYQYHWDHDYIKLHVLKRKSASQLVMKTDIFGSI